MLRPTAVPRLLAVVAATFAMLFTATLLASAASAAQISGVAYKDLNRDGVKQAAEEPLAGKEIYAVDALGSAANHAPTDASGRYVIADVPAGAYSVRYGQVEWWELWQDWAPSTTGSERPHVAIQLTDTATVDFGWRPIVRSTDENAPISSYVAPDGLRVNSYNDVVAAKKVHDTLALGSMRAAEASHTTIRFGLRPSNYCSVALSSVDGGQYTDFSAACHIEYVNWLNKGDNGLFHEYGHAWSQYYAYMVQQDGTFASYLQARGLAGDPRIGSTEQWSPKEMIAEDYRQLFGSTNAAAGAQANLDIPRASQVAGLREFLAGPFMLPPAAPPPPPPATPPPPPPPSSSVTMHVAALTATAAKTSGGWRATPTVTVRDAAQQAVGGVAVTLRWTHSKSGASGQLTCVTQTTGACSASADLTTKIDSVTISVLSASKAGATYASGADTAGPITVKRPR
jgi:hypothetical protein